MATLAKEVAFSCPECGAPMKRRESRYGHFYGCTRYPDCRGAHGCHPDGRPLGTPANAETKRLRIAAHDAFDGWWRAKQMRRSDGYKWLREKMGLSKSKCHIGMFNKQQCERVIELVRNEK